jgi:GT2 family glycosyltransferase
MKFVTVIVSFNNFSSTKEFLKSYSNLSKTHENILVVVDNSTEKDCQLENYISDFPGVIYLRQEENKGYMAACNFGYSFVRSKFNSEHVVIYSNNDVVFECQNFFDLVAARFLENKHIGVLSPYAFDVNSKKNLNPFLLNRPSKLMLLKLKLLYSNYYVAKFFNAFRKVKAKSESESHVIDKIYATHGCMLIMRSSLFNDFPDDKYFLYGEEITIAELARSKKMQTQYCKEIKIKHVSHSTTGLTFSRNEFNYKSYAIEYVLKTYKW